MDINWNKRGSGWIIKKNKFHPQDSQAVEQGPRVFGQCPSLGVFNAWLGKALSSLVWPHSGACWGQRSGFSICWSKHSWIGSLTQFMRHLSYKNISSTFRKKTSSKANIDGFPTIVTVNWDAFQIPSSAKGRKALQFCPLPFYLFSLIWEWFPLVLPIPDPFCIIQNLLSSDYQFPFLSSLSVHNAQSGAGT